MNKKSYGICFVIFLAVLIFAFYWRGQIERTLVDRFDDQRPSHAPYDGCTWVKTEFSEVSVFEQRCPGSTEEPHLFESDHGTVLQTPVTQFGYSFKIQIYAKAVSQDPVNVMREWYRKLTPDQQKVCEIQDADEPLQNLQNGSVMWTEDPHPMSHKTRY